MSLKTRMCGLFLFLLGVILSCCVTAERIWVSTDLHIASNGEIQMEAYEMLLRTPEAGDVLVLMGDLANSGHLEEHRTVIRGLDSIAGNVKVYVIPGNHDLSVEVPPENFAALYHAYGYDSAVSSDPDSLSYAAVTSDGICLLMLDTNVWDKERQAVLHGGVGESVIRWVASVLEQLPGDMPVLVFGHHPLYPFEGTDTTAEAEKICRVLETGNVLAYLCGHRHSNGTEASGGLRQIMTGVPWSYPAYIGMIEQDREMWSYSAETLFDSGSETFRSMRTASAELAARMAAGSLEGTSFEDDPEAEVWFMQFFAAVLDGTLAETAEVLRAEPGYEHWRHAEVRSAVKPWIIEMMEGTHEDYHKIKLGHAAGSSRDGND